MSKILTSGEAANACQTCALPPRHAQDFPIEWEGDHYVTRRELVKFLTLGSFLLAASNWCVALFSRFRKVGISREQRLGSIEDLERHDVLLFRYPSEQDPCIAIRTRSGKFAAYSQVCTHLSCAVVYDKERDQLLCPCHRGAFDVYSGAPLAGPPTRSLQRVTLEQRAGELFAVSKEA